MMDKHSKVYQYFSFSLYISLKINVFQGTDKKLPLDLFERLELIELIDSKFLLKLIFFYIIKIFFQLSILDI